MACASDNARYQDNANLERPPEVPIDKQAAEQIAANEIDPPIRRHGKGLKSDVYKPEDPTTELRIKRNFDESWSLLGRAILHNELKVADEDRSKGAYYIAYDGGGLLNSATSFFADKKDKTTYLVLVEPEGEETKVTVSLASKDEQTGTKHNKDGGSDDSSVDKSASLSELLFDTLHDVVKED
jgi:uncharacterized lipoprotein